MMSHGTTHNNDFECNRAFAALLRHCLELLQHCSILLLEKPSLQIFSYKHHLVKNVLKLSVSVPPRKSQSDVSYITLIITLIIIII